MKKLMLYILLTLQARCHASLLPQQPPTVRLSMHEANLLVKSALQCRHTLQPFSTTLHDDGQHPLNITMIPADLDEYLKEHEQRTAQAKQEFFEKKQINLKNKLHTAHAEIYAWKCCSKILFIIASLTTMYAYYVHSITTRQ